MSSAVPEPGSSAACNRASRSCWSRALRGLGDHPFDDWYLAEMATHPLTNPSASGTRRCSERMDLAKLLLSSQSDVSTNSIPSAPASSAVHTPNAPATAMRARAP